MDNNFTIKERILQVAKYKGFTLENFCNKIGLTYGNFKGKAKETPINSDAIVNILSIIPDINIEWLLTGEGQMLKEQPPVHSSIKPDDINRFPLKTDTSLHTVRIPLYNVEAIGGVVEVYDSIADTEPIAWLEIPNLPKCDGAIYMVGDSMYPLLKSGDIIIYKVLNDLQNILWGEMYLLSIAHNGDTFLTVKYVKQSETPGYVKLISYNEHHQPKDFPFDAIRFAAHIKASVRINSMG
jgi:phage repressor protein C with HTH and peptisase S24 domain